MGSLFAENPQQLKNSSASAWVEKSMQSLSGEMHEYLHCTGTGGGVWILLCGVLIGDFVGLGVGIEVGVDVGVDVAVEVLEGVIWTVDAGVFWLFSMLDWRFLEGEKTPMA